MGQEQSIIQTGARSILEEHPGETDVTDVCGETALAGDGAERTGSGVQKTVARGSWDEDGCQTGAGE